MRQDPMVWSPAAAILLPCGGSTIDHLLVVATWLGLGVEELKQPFHPYRQPPHPFEDLADTAEEGLDQCLQEILHD